MPDAGDEAIRDLCRARCDAKSDERKSRQRPKAFLPRDGHNYRNSAAWTAAHRRYLREKAVEHPAQRGALESYIQATEQSRDRIESPETQFQIQSLDWNLYPLACALMALKGVAWLTGTCLAVELAGFIWSIGQMDELYEDIEKIE